MSKYRYLLWDIDGTILDFLKAEHAAIRSLFIRYGYGECSDSMIAEYSAINTRYWQALERNEITKAQVLTGRFREFFTLFGIPTDRIEEFNRDYQLALGDTIVFRDDCKELLESLKGKYILAAVTNGTLAAQKKKLSLSGLDRIFDRIFISEEIGVEKPNKEFFDRAFAGLDLRDRGEALIIGDSLTSDIKGGNNAGIDTCWYNPGGKPNDKGVSVTYEIRNLSEIPHILGTEE